MGDADESERSNKRREINRQSSEFNNPNNNPCTKVNINYYHRNIVNTLIVGFLAGTQDGKQLCYSKCR